MRILICGSTGNIGQQTINYLKTTRHKIVGISYYHNYELAKKIKTNYFYSPINKSNVSSYGDLIQKSKPNLIINAIIGFAGLEVTLLALKYKINLGLANKESVVVAGQFINKLAKKNNVTIYPIDSEHTSLMHILKHCGKKFSEIYISASGGPFYNFNKTDLNTITYKQAIKHPTWKMGGKISIDSATLMNKCFEIIECYWYFKTKKINVLYHPQSLVHAIVRYKTRSFACIYKPSMVIPIGMVINNFKTLKQTIQGINLEKTNYQLSKIKYSQPIKWGYEIINNPQSSLPIILNAANECFVEKFKEGKIKFNDIVRLIKKCVDKITLKKVTSINEIYKIDKTTRELCHTV